MTIQEKIKELEEKQAEFIAKFAKEIEELKQEQEKQPKGRYDWLEDGSKYYWIAGSGNVCKMRWDGHGPDYGSLSIGNVFQTGEEAEFEVERLKVIKELKEFSRPFVADESNFYILYNTDFKDLAIACTRIEQKNDIHFLTLEHARQAIEAVGEDRIKKYYFRVED